ncbi:MAG: polysaccharide export protein [Smithellaceae bacterium]|nr:polysaccharide export protein [Smithellaceae bacterium]
MEEEFNCMVFLSKALVRNCRFYSIFYFSLAIMLAFLTSCGGNNVVTITEVQNPAQVLKKEDLAKLQEIKKSVASAKGDEGLSTILQKTPTMTVAQYLTEHPEARESIGTDYHIGPYDVLNISVYGEKDLSSESNRVSGDGYISFPLIGRVKVANLTASQVEELISSKLEQGQYLYNANISVMVTGYESKKYSALGALKTPGNYPLQPNERVLDGISKAGGIDNSDAGERQEAFIIRTLNIGQQNEQKILIKIDLQNLLKGNDQISNIVLADRDVIYVPKADFFYIIGQVKNPGSYTFNKKDVTIVEAISMAGGFTPIAARSKTRIVRLENSAQKIYEVDVDAITKAGKISNAIPIKPNDLIVVPESFF